MQLIDLHVDPGVVCILWYCKMHSAISNYCTEWKYLMQQYTAAVVMATSAVWIPWQIYWIAGFSK